MEGSWACADLAPLPPVEELLQIDEYSPGDALQFQGGFVEGEEAAVTLGSLDEISTVEKVVFLFGGSQNQETITLRLYEDTVGTADPGTLRFERDLQIAGSNSMRSICPRKKSPSTRGRAFVCRSA